VTGHLHDIARTPRPICASRRFLPKCSPQLILSKYPRFCCSTATVALNCLRSPPCQFLYLLADLAKLLKPGSLRFASSTKCSLKRRKKGALPPPLCSARTQYFIYVGKYVGWIWIWLFAKNLSQELTNGAAAARVMASTIAA